MVLQVGRRSAGKGECISRIYVPITRNNPTSAYRSVVNVLIETRVSVSYSCQPYPIMVLSNIVARPPHVLLPMKETHNTWTFIVRTEVPSVPETPNLPRRRVTA